MLKDRIKNKEQLVGMYVQLSDISIARIAGLAGYDFVWVDMEHGATLARFGRRYVVGRG